MFLSRIMKVFYSLFTLDRLEGEQKKAIMTWIGAGVLNLFMYALSVKWQFTSDSLIYFSLVITTTFAFAMDRRESFLMSNRILNEFNKTSDLKYIGNSRDAINWLKDHSHDVQRVRNTVYRYMPGIGRDVRNYLPEMAECMREVLRDRDAYWVDIAIGPSQEKGQNRTSIKDQEQAIYDIYSYIPDKQKQQYEAKSLEVNAPIIQIMLAEYKKGDLVVTVGYRFLDGEKDMVFMSSNDRVFKYFSDYFDSLYRKGSFIYEPQLNSPTSPQSGKRSLLSKILGNPNP